MVYRGVTVAAVALFWAATAAAGALAPGYSARTDWVSSLAGRGSSVAALGIAALLGVAVAHLAAAAVLRGPAGGALAVAGIAGLVVAAFRTGCPLGAAGCGTAPNDAPPDLADRLHVAGVVAYEIAFVLTAVLVAAGVRAASRRRGTAWRVISAAVAVASVALLLRTGGADTGAWQRAWLAVHHLWLVATVLTASGWRLYQSGDGSHRVR